MDIKLKDVNRSQTLADICVHRWGTSKSGGLTTQKCCFCSWFKGNPHGYSQMEGCLRLLFRWWSFFCLHSWDHYRSSANLFCGWVNRQCILRCCSVSHTEFFFLAVEVIHKRCYPQPSPNGNRPAMVVRVVTTQVARAEEGRQLQVLEALFDRCWCAHCVVVPIIAPVVGNMSMKPILLH